MLPRLNKPYSMLFDLLVIWYGFYQGLHIIVNSLSLLALADGRSPYHILAPAEGWSPQVIPVFIGLVIIDLINGLVSLIFVGGYFKDTRWHLWLGTITLSISVYGMAILDYFTAANGAWHGNLLIYLFINLTFIPVLVLYVLLGNRGARGISIISHRRRMK